MNETIQKIKDFFAKYWFIGSTLAIALLAFVAQRRGNTIKDLLFQIQRTKLGEKLKAISEKEAKDEAAYKENRDAYLALKRRHPEHFSDSE